MVSFSSLIAAVTLLCPSCGAYSEKTKCKSTPGSQSWPSLSEWSNLNASVAGRLIQPIPPAAVCHSDQPTFNNESCNYVTARWIDYSFHADDPISVDSPNFNNDSCLPVPQAPCSSEGFPVYVVNATSAEDVKAGVNFAREKNIRLNVKASGHDFLGRSTAPNSLSIWTRYLRGIEIIESFKPTNGSNTTGIPAVKIATGTPMRDIYSTTAEKNLTIVGGTADDISLGGYLTGGGHSPISSVYGLAVDQVLEMEVVVASGKILVANQNQNRDLFWALRGGGGSTFGIITSVILKTLPTMPVSAYTLALSTPVNSSVFWDVMAYILSQSPQISDSGLAGYLYISPFSPGLGPNNSTVSGCFGSFLTLNTTNTASALFSPFEQYINKTWPEQVQIYGNGSELSSLYEWYLANHNTFAAGGDGVIGNRLLDKEALSKPLPILKQTIQDSIQPGGIGNINLIAGKGVRDARPVGGRGSMHPSWRTAYAEFVTSVTWQPLNKSEQVAAQNALTYKGVEALRQLAPKAGAYLNEGDPNELNYQEVYWGENYQRLLKIKRKIDPHDVFWCHPCVGDERWNVTDNVLCRV